jgi:hypothetical protein
METLRSLTLYAKLVLQAWWQLVIGFLGAIYGVVGAFKTGLVVPWWAGVGVAVAALFWAQFRAFHLLHLELEAQTSTPALLRRAGLVNELGSTYWPGQIGRPVDRADSYSATEADELYVRVVLSPRQPQPAAELSQVARDAFRASLDSSTIEWWLQRYTGTSCTWTLESHTHHRAVAVRPPCGTSTGSAVLYGDAQLLLPIGVHSPRATLLIDVVFRPDPTKALLLLSRSELYALCHALTKTALDEVAPVIFPEVSKRGSRFRKPPAPIGPSIFLAAFGPSKTIADFVDLSDLIQAPAADVSSINMKASIENPTGVFLDKRARDTLIKSGLKNFLAASQFVDFETPIDTLKLDPDLETRVA